MKRRNLTPFQKTELALLLEPLLSPGQGARTELLPNSAKVNTRDEVAKIAGVSGDTVHRVKAIKQAAAEGRESQFDLLVLV